MERQWCWWWRRGYEATGHVGEGLAHEACRGCPLVTYMIKSIVKEQRFLKYMRTILNLTPQGLKLSFLQSIPRHIPQCHVQLLMLIVKCSRFHLLLLNNSIIVFWSSSVQQTELRSKVLQLLPSFTIRHGSKIELTGPLVKSLLNLWTRFLGSNPNSSTHSIGHCHIASNSVTW